jgi:hypothetical protein
LSVITSPSLNLLRQKALDLGWHKVAVPEERASSFDDANERARWWRENFGEHALCGKASGLEEWAFDSGGLWFAVVQNGHQDLTFYFRRKDDAVLFRVMQG